MGRTRVEFQQFWKAYGRAFGYQPNRVRAERVWGRLSDIDRRAALKGIEPYSERCRLDGIAMMHASNYLTYRRWEDEPVEAATKTELFPADPPSHPVVDPFDGMEVW